MPEHSELGVIFLAPHRIRPGQFVYTPDSNRIGKVVEVAGTGAIVRLRHSAVRVEEQPHSVSVLQRAYLYPEMRVFYGSDEAGLPKAGRIRDFLLDGNQISYLVRFPNGEELWLEEEDLETRTFRPNPDPTDALAAGYCETQFFYDRRLAVQQVLMHARQHSGGLTGLLSASVDLLPHQVAVVWRVLSDPIQRYLLADEVGMGKTIEAAAILRQILLDDPKARVVVAAPPTLIQQWKRELTEKFHFVEFEDRWCVVPFAELTRLSASEVDAIVLDEAHHLVSPKNGQEHLDYALLARLVHAVPRLFLLTATPVLGDAMATLRLLHLLDPQVYSLEDIAGFTRKLEKRQEYGQLLISLMPGLAGFPLSRLVKGLLTTFADDPVVVGYAERLTQPGITQEQIDDTVRWLKRYLMETYRLHQRLVRTRRADLTWELLPRTAEVRVEADLNVEEMEMLASALEDWRDAAQRFASDAESPMEEPLARRYIQLFDALAEGVASFSRTLAHQVSGVKSGALPSFPDDLTYLDRLQERVGEISDPDSKLEGLVEVIKRYRRTIAHPITGAVKCVLFTTSSEDARDASLVLARAFGRDAIVTVLTGDDPETVEEAVRQFEEGRTPMVLVADRSGEEGLNLQCADAVVHLDLPLDPARLEQRIGRVDRFGRKHAGVPQTIFLPTDEEGSPWDAWRELLDKAFELFTSSLSDVQVQLQAIQFELTLQLFRLGADGPLRSKEWVREALARERKRLDEQHQVDKLVVSDDRIAPQFDVLEAEDTAENYENLNRWLVDTLQFERRPVPQGGPEPFKFRWRSHKENPSTLMSKWPWEDELAPVLEWPHSYSREVARANPGTRLLRPGSSLVTTLEKVMRYEDRGSSFATWRHHPRWPRGARGEWLGFRLTYVVEFDMVAVNERMAERLDRSARAAVRRRADALFAPWIETLTLDIHLQPETDPLVDEILATPYLAADRKGSDYNLGSRREDLYRLVDPALFRQRCHEVRQKSNRLIQESPSFRARVEEGIRKARTELGTRMELLQRRQQQLELQTGRRDPAIEYELAVSQALMDVVTSPRIRLDAIGCFVISDQPLGRRGK